MLGRLPLLGGLLGLALALGLGCVQIADGIRNRNGNQNVIDLVRSFPVGSTFGSAWKDAGNPAKQTSADRLTVGYTGSCPQLGSPDPDGWSFAVMKGNVTIKVSR